MGDTTSIEHGWVAVELRDDPKVLYLHQDEDGMNYNRTETVDLTLDSADLIEEVARISGLSIDEVSDLLSPWIEPMPLRKDGYSGANQYGPYGEGSSGGVSSGGVRYASAANSSGEADDSSRKAARWETKGLHAEAAAKHLVAAKDSEALGLPGQAKRHMEQAARHQHKAYGLSGGSNAPASTAAQGSHKHELHVEHGGQVHTSYHKTATGARRALSEHLQQTGGKGKAVITPAGNKLGAKPVPVELHESGTPVVRHGSGIAVKV